jgi:NADH-quinone oxidoreductase subunit J
MTAAALAVVLLPNIFRSALALVVCFLAVAGIFVTLSADFLAAVQVLIYVGAIAILIILSIMLTREVQRGNLSNRLRLPAFIMCLLFLGITIFAMLNTAWPLSAEAPQEPTTSVLANILFSEDGLFLLVEIGALLLLATIIGAITIVRDK